MATSKLSLVKTDVHDLSKKPMGTSPRLASIKPSPIHPITKPLPESALKELKIEISFLIKQDKKSNYLKGQKLDLLQKERARGRTGTFMRDLREMHINYHKANRLIKFYRRVQAFIASKSLEDAKLAAKWGGIEDAKDFELAMQSKEADAQLAALNVLADAEREKVKQAQAKSKDQPAGYRIVISLSDGQKDKFKKAWSALSDGQRTSVVYKAVLNAAR
jgi:hypothetical protein